MSALYIEIDPQQRKILDYPKELEINWKNIGGLAYLTDDQLKDLTWAGYPNSGFIKVCNENSNYLRDFTYENKLFEDMKDIMKDRLSSLKSIKESSGVIVNNSYHINIDIENKLNMLCKYQECILDSNIKFNWKVTGSFFELTSNKFIDLFLKIQKYSQSLVDIECELFSSIDKCNTIFDLLLIDLENISWTDNKIEI